MKQELQKEKIEYFASGEDVLNRLQQSSEMIAGFEQLREDWKERFLDYFTGVRTLPLTYDPIFKMIFHPDIHRDWLSRLVSALLGREVTIVEILPNENSMIAGGSILVMDILVQLEDGSLANVEIQKFPYTFPAERMSCYSADLVMRQYNRVKGNKGKNFVYSDIKKVYTIVLFEKSLPVFHEIEEFYHVGKTIFNTGLRLNLIQEYYLVALDVFRRNVYTVEKNERNGWLSLLVTDTVKDMEQIIQWYPFLEEVYAQMQSYLAKPEEVLGMFSEALSILDHNTTLYMIEQQQKEIDELSGMVSEQAETISEQAEIIDKLKAELAKHES